MVLTKARLLKCYFPLHGENSGLQIMNAHGSTPTPVFLLVRMVVKGGWVVKVTMWFPEGS